jgi:hypothetical protein
MDVQRDARCVCTVTENPNILKEEEMRYWQNRAPFPLEVHSALPARGAGRMDRSGRPQVDNDIVEQCSNPRELDLLRAP